MTLKKADEYIERERIDSLAIQILLPHLDYVPETICDMCQQCAEKMLKQVYLDHGSFPPRCHGLNEGIMSSAGLRLSAFAEAGACCIQLALGLATRTEAVLAGAASVIYGVLTPF